MKRLASQVKVNDEVYYHGAYRTVIAIEKLIDIIIYLRGGYELIKSHNTVVEVRS